MPEDESCPFCTEGAGFHGWPCTAYRQVHWVHPELVGPGNSKEFMDWLRARRKREKSV